MSMPVTALDPGTLRANPAPAPASYLVMACRPSEGRPGRVVRLQCNSVRAAAMASRTYKKWGWAVVVLPEVP